jgi:hypothetical protein
MTRAARYFCYPNGSIKHSSHEDICNLLAEFSHVQAPHNRQVEAVVRQPDRVRTWAAPLNPSGSTIFLSFSRSY